MLDGNGSLIPIVDMIDIVIATSWWTHMIVSNGGLIPTSIIGLVIAIDERKHMIIGNWILIPIANISVVCNFVQQTNSNGQHWPRY